MKKRIIRSDYFLSEILLNKIEEGFEVYSINDLLKTTEKKHRSVFHKLFKYRLVPFIKILFMICYRFFVRSENESTTLYFAIDRIDLLASLIVMNKSDKKQVLWLWNPVSAIMGSSRQFKFYLNLLKRTGLEIWTFDQVDAIKYGLKYHPQLYCQKLCQLSCTLEITNDAFFVGQDKGRLSFLKNLKSAFDSNGLALSIHLIRDCNVIYNHEDLAFFEIKQLRYNEYLEILNRSKCIVEIVQNGQTGLTLRSLESLFFGKKLITNNSSIVDYDFYHPSNILIINDVINEERLREFFLLEYDSSISKYQGNYEVEKFLEIIFE